MPNTNTTYNAPFYFHNVQPIAHLKEYDLDGAHDAIVTLYFADETKADSQVQVYFDNGKPNITWRSSSATTTVEQAERAAFMVRLATDIAKQWQRNNATNVRALPANNEGPFLTNSPDAWRKVNS